MNTNETKAKIWGLCADKGLFNKIKGEHLQQVQVLFEKIVSNYKEFQPTQNLFDKVMDQFTIEIQKTYTNSFDKTEYESLLKPSVPDKIDFSDAKDGHLENLERIVEEKQKERQSIFDLPHSSNMNTSMNTGMNTGMNLVIPATLNTTVNTNANVPKKDIESILMTQNKILIHILETQIKILDALKK